ncbi:hypothetical protein Tco_1407057 [Tanacetum coccineum]
MDWYTNNALWLYWKRDDDEEVLTYDEFSDLEKENLSEDNEIAEIFRIETGIFNFETPLCKEFKEFNHLLQIDVDVLIGDLSGFKTYEDYKEHNEDIFHECKPFSFESGHIEWTTCNSSEYGYCDGGKLPGMIRVSDMTYFQNYEWYEGLKNDGDLKEESLKEKAILEGSWGSKNREGKNFYSWLKESFGNYHELDYELMMKSKEYWWGKKYEEESSKDAWSNYLPNDDNDAIQANQ